MSISKLSLLALVSAAAALPGGNNWPLPLPSWGTGTFAPFKPIISSLFPQLGAPLTPEILATFAEPTLANIARNSYITRKGSKLLLNGERYIGGAANVYWLGLDENVIPPAGEPFYEPFNASYPALGRITEVMNTLVTMGAKTIRSQTLGVSTGNPLSIMPTLGAVNEEAFATIDWAIFQARQHGLRIIIPLTDAFDYYHGGRYNFLRWRGVNITQNDASPLVDEFFTNRQIIDDFKNYIRIHMTHKNPHTGLTYAQDPTILAYETGNELYGSIWGDMNVPRAWVQEIAQHIKKLGPHKLVLDGTYGVNSTHLDIPEVDIYSDHFYPLNATRLSEGIERVRGAGKVYWSGEYDWTGLNGKETPQGDSLETWFGVIEADQKREDSVVAGDAFWSLFMHNVPDCKSFVNHSDGFTLQYNNPENSAYIDGQISLVRQHYFRMQGIEVDGYLPAVACPQNYVPGYGAQYTTY
ncbi:hypothetical protein V494_07771 [Pseudogymnoascus sp. VKM F-4513 (FW-928)]|nr:hypothetical protein V494_07771 [Pseudogymnoascus sp. VKM F-4513 (FW-928)]